MEESTQMPPTTPDQGRSLMGRLKDRFKGSEPSAEAMARGSELATARLEGNELMALARQSLTTEQAAAAELDAQYGQIAEARQQVSEEVGIQRLIADYAQGKVTISPEQRIALQTAVNNGVVDTRQLALQLLDHEDAAAAKEAALAAARGELPNEPWQRETDLASELEVSEARQLAAGAEIATELQKALSEGGLNREVFARARDLAKTMVRAEGAVNTTLAKLRDRLGRRFPDQAADFGKHSDAFAEARGAEVQTIVLPESTNLSPDIIAQRAQELVSSHGVKDSAIEARALRELGVSFEGEGDQKTPIIQEGSLAARLFESGDFGTKLDEALKNAVEAATENPRLATKALEIAHLAFQVKETERALKSKAERVGALAIADEKDMLQWQLEQAGREEKAMERRTKISGWLSQKWGKVQEGARGISESTTARAARLEARVQTAYASAREKVVGSADSIRTLADTLGARVEARIEAVAPQSERQAALAAEMSQLEARLAEIRGELASPVAFATTGD